MYSVLNFDCRARLKNLVPVVEHLGKAHSLGGREGGREREREKKIGVRFGEDKSENMEWWSPQSQIVQCCQLKSDPLAGAPHCAMGSDFSCW